MYLPVEVCESAPQLSSAHMDINPQNVTYHCNAGLSFPDGRASITIPCPCRQASDEVLAGLTCQGELLLHV